MNEEDELGARREKEFFNFKIRNEKAKADRKNYREVKQKLMQELIERKIAVLPESKQGNVREIFDEAKESEQPSRFVYEMGYDMGAFEGVDVELETLKSYEKFIQGQ